MRPCHLTVIHHASSLFILRQSTEPFSNDLLKYRFTTFIICASYCKVLAKRRGGRGDGVGGEMGQEERIAGYSTYFSELLFESDENVDTGLAWTRYSLMAALFLTMGIGSCSSAVFVFVLSCHFPLKTLLPVSDKRNKRELENAFIYFHHYLWAVGLWKLLVPNALKCRGPAPVNPGNSKGRWHQRSGNNSLFKW